MEPTKEEWWSQGQVRLAPKITTSMLEMEMELKSTRAWGGSNVLDLFLMKAQHQSPCFSSSLPWYPPKSTSLMQYQVEEFKKKKKKNKRARSNLPQGMTWLMPASYSAYSITRSLYFGMWMSSRMKKSSSSSERNFFVIVQLWPRFMSYLIEAPRLVQRNKKEKWLFKPWIEVGRPLMIL